MMKLSGFRCSFLTYSLFSERFYVLQMLQVEKAQNTVVDLKQSKHQALLDEFWQNMRPNITRNKPEDWGDVGFQGLDPTTDFRGLGTSYHLSVTYSCETPTSQISWIK